MKGFPLLRTAAALLLGAGLCLATACEQKPAAATTSPLTAPADSTQAVAAMAYVCPMSCEGSASNSPGKCPVCEMTLEANPDYKPSVQ